MWSWNHRVGPTLSKGVNPASIVGFQPLAAWGGGALESGAQSPHNVESDSAEVISPGKDRL